MIIGKAISPFALSKKIVAIISIVWNDATTWNDATNWTE